MSAVLWIWTTFVRFRILEKMNNLNSKSLSGKLQVYGLFLVQYPRNIQCIPNTSFILFENKHFAVET